MDQWTKGVKLPFGTSGGIGATVLHGSLGCKVPGGSLGEGSTGIISGDGDIPNPERRKKLLNTSKN